MNITFNILPDLIIDEILNGLEYSNQLELRYCNKRINQLLKFKVFASLSVLVHKDIALQNSKYVKELRGSIFKEFFEFKDQFPNLESIEVDEADYKGSDVFHQLHSLDIKLKSLTLTLNEPFPTQSQFDFNHVIKNLRFLKLKLIRTTPEHLNVLDMLQIPGLKTLHLSICNLPKNVLVIINRNFPMLEKLTLSYNNRPVIRCDIEVALISTTFLKLKTLEFSFIYLQNYHQILCQNFPQLNFFELYYSGSVAELDLKIVNPFNQLLSLAIPLKVLSINDVLILQNLKDAKFKLCENFDGKSMQNIFSLPKLSKLTILNNVPDNLFENLICKSPLNSLTTFDGRALSHHFLKFLQFKAPSLTRLDLLYRYGEFVIGSNTFSEINGQTILKLKYLTVNEYALEFVDWVKAQAPNVEITYYEDF